MPENVKPSHLHVTLAKFTTVLGFIRVHRARNCNDVAVVLKNSSYNIPMSTHLYGPGKSSNQVGIANKKYIKHFYFSHKLQV